MKKSILGALLLGSFGFATAQTVVFNKTTEVYGEILQNSNGNRVFTLTNKGDKPLILSNVKASCGCTTPEWSKDPILPGKSTEIKVGYNTGIVGPFSKQIEVFSNDPQNGRIVLNITGKVNPVAIKTPMEEIVVESKEKVVETAKNVASVVKKAAANTKTKIKTATKDLPTKLGLKSDKTVK